MLETGVIAQAAGTTAAALATHQVLPTFDNGPSGQPTTMETWVEGSPQNLETNFQLAQTTFPIDGTVSGHPSTISPFQDVTPLLRLSLNARPQISTSTLGMNFVHEPLTELLRVERSADVFLDQFEDFFTEVKLPQFFKFNKVKAARTHIAGIMKDTVDLANSLALPDVNVLGTSQPTTKGFPFGKLEGKADETIYPRCIKSYVAALEFLSAIHTFITDPYVSTEAVANYAGKFKDHLYKLTPIDPKTAGNSWVERLLTGRRIIDDNNKTQFLDQIFPKGRKEPAVANPRVQMIWSWAVNETMTAFRRALPNKELLSLLCANRPNSYDRRDPEHAIKPETWYEKFATLIQTNRLPSGELLPTGFKITPEEVLSAMKAIIQTQVGLYRPNCALRPITVNEAKYIHWFLENRPEDFRSVTWTISNFFDGEKPFAGNSAARFCWGITKRLDPTLTYGTDIEKYFREWTRRIDEEGSTLPPPHLPMTQKAAEPKATGQTRPEAVTVVATEPDSTPRSTTASITSWQEFAQRYGELTVLVGNRGTWNTKLLNQWWDNIDGTVQERIKQYAQNGGGAWSQFVGATSQNEIKMFREFLRKWLENKGVIAKP